MEKWNNRPICKGESKLLSPSKEKEGIELYKMKVKKLKKKIGEKIAEKNFANK
jgi:hypothetical protein